MSLYSKLQKQIEGSVLEFCKILAEKYDFLEEDDLFTTWKEMAKSKKSRKPKKKSSYQHFYKKMYSELKEQNPDLSFGDIAKRISNLWKTMDQEEKNKYSSSPVLQESQEDVMDMTQMDKSPSPVVSTTPVVTASVSPIVEMDTSSSQQKKKKKTHKKKASPSSPLSSPSPIKEKIEDKSNDDYENMKIAELKKLCKEKGLTIKGMTKKSEFIDLLRKLDEEMVQKGDDSESDSESFAYLLEGEDNIIN